MKPTRGGEGERALAVFIDFENLGLGFQNRRDRFDIHKVLERLVEKGKIVAKKAYADWSRFSSYTTALHEAAIELVEIPRRGVSGKNSADIRLVVDAIDLAYSKDHIDTFVIVSGDSDFSPLVSKLKELGKHVIGMGLADATSDLLRDNCDEFIYYEDLDRAPIIPVSMNENIPERKRKAFSLLLESLLALRRENKEIIYSSMIKDTMKRKKPSFNEEYYGYRTFSEFLEDAQRLGLLELEKHKPSGMYIVTRFGLEMDKQSGEDTAHRGSTSGSVTSGSASGGDRDRLSEGRAGSQERGGTTGECARRTASSSSSAPLRPKYAELQEPLSPLDYPLGRALIEEVEWEDEVDEVPSYGSTPPPAVLRHTASSTTRGGDSGAKQPGSRSARRPPPTSSGSVPNPLPKAPRVGSAGVSTAPEIGSDDAPGRIERNAESRRRRGGGVSRRSETSAGKGVSAGLGRDRSGAETTAHAPRAAATSQKMDQDVRISPTSSIGSSAPTAEPISDEEAEFRAGLED